MMHPDTELKFISEEIGSGVVATKFIPAGTITWVLDELDREFTPSEVDRLDPLHQNILNTYTYRNKKGNFVLCWDIGRFVNHSFKSNCLSTAYDFELAIRDIQPGEELTDDYGYLNVMSPFRPVDEGTERKVVYPDALPNFYKSWDKKIKKVFPDIIEQEQPLKPIISDELWETIHSIIEGREEMESILKNYFKE
jgi:hypothetical protein